MNNRLLIRLVLTLVGCCCGMHRSLLASGAAGSGEEWNLGGHAKFQYIDTSIPANSVLHEVSGDNLQERNLEIRLKFSARHGHWDIDTHAQLITIQSNMPTDHAYLPDLIYPGVDVINDKQRWFDLTHEISNGNRDATLVRFDRASVSYSDDKTVLRFGRQAISWGNGLLFTPMDILNPFDPTAVDKEYKSGDDMLYVQSLLDNGDDVQAVAVVRRDPSNADVQADQSSFALKYHALRLGREFDLMASRHHGETALGLGLSSDLGGAIWRGDLVWTDTEHGSAWTAVMGVTGSWNGGGHNWTGLIEYFHNGFGQPAGHYTVAGLATNPALLERIARGELFNIGRHYLGAAVTLEATPLLNLTCNTFINVTDPSAFAQLVLSYDWQQDLQLLAALGIPIGPDGSEYGGIDSRQQGLYLSSGASLFAQLAWYF